MPVQIILISFLIFALSRVLLRFRGGQIKSGEFIFWGVLFFLAIIGILFPEETTSIANFLGVGRGVDLVVYVSLVTLFYLVFRVYVLLQDTQKEISEIVREVALRQVKNSAKK
jgi:hypothetical protein